MCVRRAARRLLRRSVHVVSCYTIVKAFCVLPQLEKRKERAQANVVTVVNEAIARYARRLPAYMHAEGDPTRAWVYVLVCMRVYMYVCNVYAGMHDRMCVCLMLYTLRCMSVCGCDAWRRAYSTQHRTHKEADSGTCAIMAIERVLRLLVL
jgi:hypothetical protein